MKKILFLAVLALSAVTWAQRLKVSENGRFLVIEGGQPFFWTADTAWELFHRCSREEVALYLAKRKSQGFNVIQAVALSELNGLDEPNVYGETPLLYNDPTTPNIRYFEHVDYVMDMADSLGMYIALLPSWGDKLFRDTWGTGPEVLDRSNARVYGKWLGKRYSDRDNIIWVLGGDRNPRSGTADVAVWNAMAEGIAEGAGGNERTLMTFHPQPNSTGGSSRWFHNAPWLDFNMQQTGHCADRPTYKLILRDYGLKGTKPVLDGEPLYEDHPNCFNAREMGYSTAEDIRRIMYWNVFAGAFGQTYGCHDVWQMYLPKREPVNGPLRPWPEALDLPMANQMKHLKNLFLSRPFLNRIPDGAMILDHQVEDDNFTVATRDKNGSYAMVYYPTGIGRTLSLTNLKGTRFKTWWFDPRTGNSFGGDRLEGSGHVFVRPPTKGVGNDWVLVIDAEDEVFLPPGRIRP